MNDALVNAEVRATALVGTIAEMAVTIATYVALDENSPAGATVYRDHALSKVAKAKAALSEIEASLRPQPPAANVVALETVAA